MFNVFFSLISKTQKGGRRQHISSAVDIIKMFAVVATDAIFAAFKKVLGDDPYDTVTGLTTRYKKYLDGRDALKSVRLLNLSSIKIGGHEF